jgi:hypothetical protein
MQPQTTNAVTIAQKIQNCICCIVVFSGAPDTTTSHYKLTDVSSLVQQVRQPCKIHRNPSRLIFAVQLRRRSSPRLILEIDIREWLPVVVADDEAGVQLLEGPSFTERLKRSPRDPQQSRRFIRLTDGFALSPMCRGNHHGNVGCRTNTGAILLSDCRQAYALAGF